METAAQKKTPGGHWAEAPTVSVPSMSRTFSKLFASITESTIWVAPDPHLRLWVYFLANADQSGRVWGSIPGISSHARVPLADTETAIKSFMSPDPYSRTKDYEGRRIEEIEGGWRLLNYRKYREMRDDEARAEQNRVSQERFRSKQSKQSKQSKPKVSRGKPQSAQAEAEAEAERSKTHLPPSDDGFALFWRAYPKKAAKQAALKAWEKLKPDESTVQAMLTALTWQKDSEGWTKEGGRYVKDPAGWISGRRWEDELATSMTANGEMHI